MTTTYTCILIIGVVVMVMLTAPCHSVEYDRFCESVCAYGRGGNLCNCNAVHFKGKRGVAYPRGGVRGRAASQDPGYEGVANGRRRSTGQWPGASASIADDQHLFWLKRALRASYKNVR